MINIILNGEKQKHFHNLQNQTRIFNLQLLWFSIVIEILGKATIQLQERNRDTDEINGEGKYQSILFAEDMILYIKGPLKPLKLKLMFILQIFVCLLCIGSSLLQIRIL